MATEDINVSKYEALFHAVEGFVRANCNFESSIPVNAAVDEIAQATSLQAVFSIPLQRQLFNMDAAIRWTFFLSVAPERAVEEGDEAATPLGSFSAQEAFTLISQIYDIGTQENVWVHFEWDDEDEEDEEEPEETEKE